VSSATERAEPRQAALSSVLEKVRSHQDAYGLSFPTRGHPRYETGPNCVWVAGFWPGMLWLAYDRTGDQDLCRQAEALLPSFVERLEKRVALNHDVGFVYLLSCRAQWMSTGDVAARDTALLAADALAVRYNTQGEFIQALGEVGAGPHAGRALIDCMMNLNLLYWAAEETGDGRYREVAYRHARTSQRHLVRDDDSTNHTFVFDPVTGDPLRGETIQGYSDTSLWARGQAWAIYGFALSAEWLEHSAFLAVSASAADRFLAESPADRVPRWDLRLPSDAPQYLDSSAAAIAVCGLLRLAKLTGRDHYKRQAHALLDSLIRDCLETRPDREGSLRHGAQHIPRDETTDGFVIYGDYFFLEALLTVSGGCPDFWGPTNR